MDICRAVPYFALKEAKRDKVWNDGLHRTEEGYSMMGDANAAHLIPLIWSVARANTDRDAQTVDRSRYTG